MKGVFLVIAACFVWALDTLIRYPLLFSGVGAKTIVLVEHGILAVLFIPVMIQMYPKLRYAKVPHLFYFSIVGILGSAVATLAFTNAFTMINPSLVILLQKLQPIVAIVLARFVLGEKTSPQFLFWAVICLVGGFLVSYKDLFPGLFSLDTDELFAKRKFLIGYGLTLVAVVGWGSSTVFGKKLATQGYKPQEIMAGRYFFAFAFLLATLLASFDVSFEHPRIVWGKIGLMVLLSGVLAMALYYQGLKTIPAKLCTLAEMFFPFFAVLVNWVFLEQALSAWQIVGGILLLLGSSVIQWKAY